MTMPTPLPEGHRLAATASPYLRRHADQPVEWYPWGPEALERARRLNRPILLSIGYAACHWCEVMAEESFADPTIAALINEHYVAIKVDREERPDLDHLYQLSHTLLNGRGGGWPLTAFLTPADQAPFFIGTYFPPVARGELPSFASVLSGIVRYLAAEGPSIAIQNDRLRAALALASAGPPPLAGAPPPAAALRARLAELFDPEWGGFARAPKFPHPVLIEALLTTWAVSATGPEPDLKALYMATLTLTRMSEGGLRDQLGGGFARYATDRQWQLPHFEQMLTDQALLIRVYADAAIATGEADFRATALAAAEFVRRSLALDDGGFAASLAADSPDGEGAYYLWTRESVRAVVGDADYELVARHYGLDRAANVGDRGWHLVVAEPLTSVAGALGIAGAEAARRLAAAREHLLAARRRRPPPARDDKRLTGANALLIRALATLARGLGQTEYGELARQTLAVLRRSAWDGRRLVGATFEGQPGPAGFLRDYAYLGDALLELLQWRYEPADMTLAMAVADALIEDFAAEDGGFYFTAAGSEPLLVRQKDWADDALPSGSGVAMRFLMRLGRLLGEGRYLAAAERTLRAAAPAIDQDPLAHGTLLAAAAEWAEPGTIIVLRGADADIEQWSAALAPLYEPNRLVLPISAKISDLPAALAQRAPGAAALAYVCRGTTCSGPFTTLAALIGALRAPG
jgi:uncharacterized protein